LLQALVEKQWIPTSWDFDSAFLHGKPIDRDVFIAAPSEYVTSGICWRLQKAVYGYGLVSAPKAWYDRLREVIQKRGFNADLSDEAIFTLNDARGNFIGILAVHVDDTIGGCTRAFHQIMDLVAKDLKIGSKEEANFHYKGLRVSTIFGKETESFVVSVDGDEYLESTLPMELPQLGQDTDYLSPKDATNYRSVAGCI
jgi:Reverse transcriptase (RNA-dependent DNA polymerase)